MGKLVEKLAPDFGFEVCCRIRSDVGSSSEINTERLHGADVVIEFTTPEAAPENLIRLAELGVPTVCGTTGWLKVLPAIKDAYKTSQTTLIYGSNFSIGVNIFDVVLRKASELFKQHPSYGAWAWEAHHIQKKDSPSGTLIKLVDTMKHAGFESEINVSATRAGFIPGTHEIGFDSPEDTITLRHTARGREGFAKGALFAADLALKKSGTFEFSEVLFDE